MQFVEAVAHRPAGLPGVFPPWYRPLWFLLVASLWWGAHGDTLRATDLGIPDEHLAAWLTAGAVATHWLMNLVETAYYVTWWRAAGVRLQFWGLFLWVYSFSLIDVAATHIRVWASDEDGAAQVWVMALTGVGGFGTTLPDSHGGLWVAFGTFGSLTLLRLVLTTWVQARGVGRAWSRTLAPTACAWLGTRLVMWWTVDLVRGQSGIAP